MHHGTGRLVAASLLGVAGVVLIATPLVLDAPNPFGLLLGLVTIGVSISVLSATRWVGPAAFSAIGLVGCTLWALLALDGFGKGTIWWDDLIEAISLAVLFGGALLALVLSRR